MRYIVTGEQMRQADAYTISNMKVPSLVLMERAALSVVAALEEENINCDHACIVCGSGNNGGDGLAIARLLHLKGYAPQVYYVGNREHASEENALQYDICKNYGVTFVDCLPKNGCITLIDAIFGTGLAREVKGSYYDIFQEMNQLPNHTVAVDIPSGISDTTGEVLGIAVRADLTVCLAYEKLGLCFAPGMEYAGKIIVKDIGIAENALPDGERIYTYDKSDLANLLPKRKSCAHKGSFGKVLMISGSSGMAGAAYLNAKAAYRMGAGLVQIYTPEENRTILQQLLPEAILSTYERFQPDQLQKLFDWADVITIGSGFGQSELSEKIFTYAMQYAKKPTVIDGDGLSILSNVLELLEFKKQVILTPHMKEMSRLLQCSVADLSSHRLEYLEDFVRDYPVVCALKDYRTIVMEYGEDIYLNVTGNESMAKAGSGDVLVGMIAGLLAQGMERKKACETAVLLHGLCGDYEKNVKGSYSVLSGELADALPFVLTTLDKE